VLCGDFFQVSHLHAPPFLPPPSLSSPLHLPDRRRPTVAASRERVRNLSAVLQGQDVGLLFPAGHLCGADSCVPPGRS
jgi:hypothetical protein